MTLKPIYEHVIPIGIVGAMGAGKTTFAQFLADQLRTAMRRPMAAPLKSMLTDMGVPHQNCYGTPEQKAQPLDILQGKSARHAMQTLGTEWGREHIGPDVWVDAWARGLPARMDGLHYAIADDVRFPNEVQRIRDLGGMLVQVQRPDIRASIAAHTSETALSETAVDYVVVNGSSEHDMIDDAMEVARRARGRYSV